MLQNFKLKWIQRYRQKIPKCAEFQSPLHQSVSRHSVRCETPLLGMENSQMRGQAIFLIWENDWGPFWFWGYWIPDKKKLYDPSFHRIAAVVRESSSSLFHDCGRCGFNRHVPALHPRTSPILFSDSIRVFLIE